MSVNQPFKACSLDMHERRLSGLRPLIGERALGRQSIPCLQDAALNRIGYLLRDLPIARLISIFKWA